MAISCFRFSAWFFIAVLILGGCSGEESGAGSDPSSSPLPPPPPVSHQLTVSISGSGTVSFDPAGSNCGAQCRSYPTGTSVTLTAVANGGNTFSAWSGACSGSNTRCTVVMNAARSVTATFVPANPANYFWPWAKQDISGPQFLDPSSQTIINNWIANGGFGSKQIDFSLDVLVADVGTPFRTFTKIPDSFFPVECDYQPMPLPAGGNVEGSSDYNCPRDDDGEREDCHLIVLAPHQNKLYEMWRADLTGGVFNGGCQAVWDMNRVYPVSGRGDTCTSADAAGFPIQPLLFTADEVAAGSIEHAIRFILPNNRISNSTYRHPATHVAGSNGSTGMPYGTRLRLKNDAATNALIAAQKPGTQVVARALQKYGMFLADGGNLAFTAQSDSRTAAKWGTPQTLGNRDLFFLTPEMFEVVKAADDVDQRKFNDCFRTCWNHADCPDNPGGPAFQCRGAVGDTPGICQ